MAGSLALLVMVAGCGPRASEETLPWGEEAVGFFDALSQAYSEGDRYGVLDFYAPTARVEKWRGDLRGGALVSDLLSWDPAELAQELEAAYLGRDEALTLVQWSATEDLGAIITTVQSGRIVGETVFDLAGPLGPSQRASPAVISAYEGLYGAFADAWSAGDADRLVRLYAPDATIRDPLVGVEVTGHDAIVRLSAGRPAALAAPTVAGRDSRTGRRPSTSDRPNTGRTRGAASGCSG